MAKSKQKSTARSMVDLPDPLEDSPRLSLGNADELISQMAGEEVDRLVGPDGHWRPEESEIVLTPTPASRPATPEELAAQLDEVFEQIRQQEPSPPPPVINTTAPEPITLPEPVLAMRKYEEAEVRDIEPRRALLDPIEEKLPAVLRPLAWLNAPVEQLPNRARFAVSVVSLLSFAGSVAALVYVLILRQGI